MLDCIDAVVGEDANDRDGVYIEPCEFEGADEDDGCASLGLALSDPSSLLSVERCISLRPNMALLMRL